MRSAEPGLQCEVYREAALPAPVVRVAARELGRLRKMQPQMPDFPILQTYLVSTVLCKEMGPV